MCACTWLCVFTGKVHGFVADLTATDLLAHVPAGSVDFVTMVFVLSAVAPGRMPAAVANVARCLTRCVRIPHLVCSFDCEQLSLRPNNLVQSHCLQSPCAIA